MRERLITQMLVDASGNPVACVCSDGSAWLVLSRKNTIPDWKRLPGPPADEPASATTYEYTSNTISVRGSPARHGVAICVRTAGESDIEPEEASVIVPAAEGRALGLAMIAAADLQEGKR